MRACAQRVGYASGVFAADVAFVDEAMNCYSRLNPPVQGGALLLSPRNPTMTKRAFLPSGHQANRPPIGYR